MKSMLCSRLEVKQKVYDVITFSKKLRDGLNVQYEAALCDDLPSMLPVTFGTSTTSNSFKHAHAVPEFCETPAINPSPKWGTTL
jgi:hypothetical protein